MLAGFLAAMLLAAFWIDRRWGEPPSRVHPVVWIGNYLQSAGAFAVQRPPASAFLLGACFWSLGAAACGLLAWFIQKVALEQFFLGVSAAKSVVDVLEGTDPGGASTIASAWLRVALLLAALALMAGLLKCLFSWRMLRSEVAAVEAALDESLEKGRERLSWLVSRDTSALSASEVRESAIESLAENLNDSVVAPIFWFVLFGLPGAAVYRFANTADAMWGYPGVYRGNNWQWAGKWAARADDVLSWIPARITAYLLSSGSRLKFGDMRKEAAKTPSPNSGWPMGAMALALGVSLRKPGVYILNPDGRAPGAADASTAQQIASRAVVRLVPAAIGILFLIAATGMASMAKIAG
ncbi:MAG: cobalamin biosynthesis protein CobD [Comamonadaceae bacterium]|nr:MAG: cobalamin biosynthesis protein CobD [Comamonadaceae bacterium]